MSQPLFTKTFTMGAPAVWRTPVILVGHAAMRKPAHLSHALLAMLAEPTGGDVLVGMARKHGGMFAAGEPLDIASEVAELLRSAASALQLPTGATVDVRILPLLAASPAGGTEPTHGMVVATVWRPVVAAPAPATPTLVPTTPTFATTTFTSALEGPTASARAQLALDSADPRSIPASPADALSVPVSPAAAAAPPVPFSAGSRPRLLLGGRFPRDEDGATEFKLAFHAAKAVDFYAPTLVGMLNSGGGTLVFGVRDDGVIVGIKLSQEGRDALRRAFDGVESGLRHAVTRAQLGVSNMLRVETEEVALGLFVVSIICVPQAGLGTQQHAYATSDGSVFVRANASTRCVREGAPMVPLASLVQVQQRLAAATAHAATIEDIMYRAYRVRSGAAIPSSLRSHTGGGRRRLVFLLCLLVAMGALAYYVTATSSHGQVAITGLRWREQTGEASKPWP